MENISNLSLLLPILGFFTGCCLGSFLNVVAYRVPRDLSIIRPGSCCPNCSSPIPWSLNLPILGWLILKGRARCCSASISPRYFIIELAVGLVFSWFFFTFSSDQEWGTLLSSCAFAWVLIGVIVIDLETMIIPDRLSIGGACLGLILSLYFPSIHNIGHHPMGLDNLHSGLTSLVGILIGSGLLYWIGAIASRLFGREALGEGDVKLLGCVGAFCGWQGAVFCIFGGALLGCVCLIPIFIWQRFAKADKQAPGQLAFGVEIPFGPYLSLAALGYFFGLKEWIIPWFEWVDKVTI